MIKHKLKKMSEGDRGITVTFTDEDSGISHERQVNAVFVDDVYDKIATLQRIQEVARGISHKIASGVIKHQEPISDVIKPQEPINE